eukprot:229391-Prorocentrum_minimum.AAC.2
MDSSVDDNGLGGREGGTYGDPTHLDEVVRVRVGRVSALDPQDVRRGSAHLPLHGFLGFQHTQFLTPPTGIRSTRARALRFDPSRGTSSRVAPLLGTLGTNNGPSGNSVRE